MANDLAILEKQLAPLAPRFADVLGTTMPVSRLIRTVMISVERLPKLLECDRQSLFNAAMSAACLGLEVDGVTGQAFLIPFKDRAQLVIGYKGMNTLAARAGYTINGAVVREGDEFDYGLGDRGFVQHKPLLTNPSRRIVAVWAVASAQGRPPIISVLGIDDILAIKAKSPGAKRSDSPWNDPAIGFPAMAEKSAKRRLARSMPLNVMQLAARMDEAVEEQGKSAWISPDRGVIVEGEVLPEREPSPTPTAQELISTSGRLATGAPSVSADPTGGAPTDAANIPELDKQLTEAAERGTAKLSKAWSGLSADERKMLKAALDRRHKPRALEIDAKTDALG